MKFLELIGIRKRTLPNINVDLSSESDYIFWCEKNVTHARQVSCSRAAFQQGKDIYPEPALTYGEYALNETFDPAYISVYANRLKRSGKVIKARELYSQIEGLDFVQPKLSAANPVFKVLGARCDATNAKKWMDFVILRNKGAHKGLSRKFFTVFKDVDMPLAVNTGLAYAESHAKDIRFTSVFLKRAKQVMTDAEFLELVIRLEEKHSDELYQHYITVGQISHIVSEFGEGDESLQQVQAMCLASKSESILKAAFVACSDKNSALYLYCANELSKLDLDCKWKRRITDFFLSLGHVSVAQELISKAPKTDLERMKNRSISSIYNLSRRGYTKAGELTIYPYYQPERLKVFYLLHNRLPYNSGGYATRSHGLITSVNKRWSIDGVSRLGYPQDRAGFESEPYVPKNVIDGITYHALNNKLHAFGKTPLEEYISQYAQELQSQCLNVKPAIIHAASNYMNGLVATSVARSLGIKSVYEVRGLWEITRISKDPAWEGSEYFNMMVNLEAQAAKEADAVFTLTKALKNELISRGVDENKITLLPNGVDSSRFVLIDRNDALANELGFDGQVIIGFIGSVVQYEGVEYIIEAANILKGRGVHNFSVLIVGDGAVLEDAKALVSRLELEETVVFTGRVPHEDVEQYYSIVDICPLPRKGLPVCEMVSPLKPFEAMAMGKTVVSSNVEALAEIVQDGVTGLLHQKDDASDLADKLELLINNPELNHRLGSTARDWVVKERDWKSIARRVDAVYSQLLDESNK
ncbi:glycosyltransferase family 4 protein [Vibrio sp. HN007]|uniref:glycosyltransferase family 4 protein n=1 Tax=Vibrio iocasae TaxID=3098914 RepID=UPI0035D45731